MRDTRRDEKYMRRALRLALKGAGRTSPNPLVGAVVVQGDRIVGEGYHREFGGPHAEVFALEAAGKKAQGATLYVNLEPCSHFGKTPPCVDRIIAAGVARVVIGGKDPNPLVNGRGIEKLRTAGIEVDMPVLAEETRRLNESYLKYIRTGLPLVILKWAQTLDGKIAGANGDSLYISGGTSRKQVHRLRSQVDGVLVGVGTVNRDNPKLTVRHVRGRQPFRLILDDRLEIRPDAGVLHDEFASRTLVFATVKDEGKERSISANGARVVYLPMGLDGRLDLQNLLHWLAEHQIISLLVEGGQRVFTSFLQQRLADKLHIYIAPKILGQGLSPIADLDFGEIREALTFARTLWRKSGEDLFVEAVLNPDLVGEVG